jgi:hypothetical protein
MPAVRVYEGCYHTGPRVMKASASSALVYRRNIHLKSEKYIQFYTNNISLPLWWFSVRYSSTSIGSLYLHDVFILSFIMYGHHVRYAFTMFVGKLWDRKINNLTGIRAFIVELSSSWGSARVWSVIADLDLRNNYTRAKKKRKKEL